MKNNTSKKRVIVKPFVPRKIPYQIPLQKVEEFIKENNSLLENVVYIGWTKRIIDGKRRLVYLVATGNTTNIARKNFKDSQDFGTRVWIL